MMINGSMDGLRIHPRGAAAYGLGLHDLLDSLLLLQSVDYEFRIYTEQTLTC